jgi:hypothetical protein
MGFGAVHLFKESKARGARHISDSIDKASRPTSIACGMSMATLVREDVLLRHRCPYKPFLKNSFTASSNIRLGLWHLLA